MQVVKSNYSTMATLRFVMLCIALFAGVANAHGYRYKPPTGLPDGAQLGDSCTPRGQPRRCGEATFLGQTETELNETDGIEGLVNKFSCTCMHAYGIYTCVHSLTLQTKRVSSVQDVHAANTGLHISRVLLQIWRSSSLFVGFMTLLILQN